MLAGGAAGALGVLAFEALVKTPQAQAASGSLPGGTFATGFAPAVVMLSQSGGSVAVNASQGNVFTLALTGSGWEMANPTNPAGDGQVIWIRLSQDSAGGRAVSWGTAYDWGASGGTAGSAPMLTSTANATDILGFAYDAALSLWCYVGAPFPQGYSSTGSSPAGISVVQSAYFPFNIEGTFDNDVAAGNSVVLMPALYTAATSGTFSTSNPQFGSLGNSVPGTALVQGTGPYVSGYGWGYTAVWLLPDLPGGATYVRVDASIPSPGGPLGMFAYEVAGLGATPQLDPGGGVASAAGFTASLDSGACPAITAAPEIIFGFGHIYDEALSAPRGAWTTMTGGGPEGNFWSGYQIATGPGGTYDWSQAAASAGSWGSAVVAIWSGSGQTASHLQLSERARLRNQESENRKQWTAITSRSRR
jgi:hypothetical protein